MWEAMGHRALGNVLLVKVIHLNARPGMQTRRTQAAPISVQMVRTACHHHYHHRSHYRLPEP